MLFDSAGFDVYTEVGTATPYKLTGGYQTFAVTYNFLIENYYYYCYYYVGTVLIFLVSKLDLVTDFR